MIFLNNKDFPIALVSLFSVFTAITLVALGLTVIFGWYMGVPALIQIHPTFPSMQFNTALGMLLSGLGLITLQLSKLKLTRLLAGTVLVMGAATGLQMVFGFDLHIDQFFIEQDLTGKTKFPGRMSPNTALCFILVASGLLFITSSLALNVKAIANALLMPIIIALAVISLLGYVLDAETAYGWGTQTGMAVHTSTGFFILGINLILLGNKNAASAMGYIPVVSIALIITTLGLSFALGIEDDKSIRLEAKRQLDIIKNIELKKLYSRQLTLNKLMLRHKQNKFSEPTDWRADAQNYITDFVFIAHYEPPYNLQMINEGWVAGDQSLAKYAIKALPDDICLLVNESGVSQFDVLQGAEPLLIEVFKAEAIKDHPISCLLAAAPLALQIRDMDSKIYNHYPLEIFANGLSVYQEVSDGSEIFFIDLNFNALNLRFELTPTQSQLTANYLPMIVLIAGLVMTAFVIIALFLLKLAQGKAREAKVLGDKLQLELSMREQVIEHAPYGILLSSSDGTIELVNSALAQLFGYQTEQELVGEPVELLVPNHKRKEHVDLRHSYNDNGQSSRRMAANLEVQGQHKDGHQIPVEVTLATINEGAKNRVIAIIVDQSERKLAQQKIKQQLQELKAINQELDDYAYIASHDLKSPLRGINQLAGWIEEDLKDSLDDETRENLTLIRSRINRMEKLLDDLLAYSRAGRTKDEITEVDTKAIITDVYDLMSKPAGMRLNLADNMPTLQTHRTPLELVLRNLISNAIKHHNKEEGIISLSAINVEGGIEFNVSDDGPGVRPDQQQRIFEMFQTLKTRDDVEGSGMGLAMVKKIVESVGGWITVQSDGRSGCTFRFFWPLTLSNNRIDYEQ